MVTLVVTAGAQETPLSAGDKIVVRLSGVPNDDIQNVSGEYTVTDSGTINLTYIGAVKAVGFKPSELGRRISSAYVGAQIYTKPTVNVSISAAASNPNRRVTIGGKVRGPGPQVFNDGMTLYEAIISAGGYNEFAKREAEVRRDGKATVYKMKDVMNGKAADPRLKPGDVVTVK